MACARRWPPATVAIGTVALACTLGSRGAGPGRRATIRRQGRHGRHGGARRPTRCSGWAGWSRIRSRAWIALRHQAVILAEAGRALTAPGRSRGEDWDAWSIAMSKAAEAAADAIDARDVDGVLFSGGDIIESCTGCHRVYLPMDG